MQCEVCGHEVQRGIIFDGRVTCRDCLIERSKQHQTCPVCGQIIKPEHGVSLEVRMQGHDAGKMANLVICPNCHVTFFDDFQYRMLTAKRV